MKTTENTVGPETVAASRIANDILDISTLETRKGDEVSEFDFHVWRLKDALEMAFREGQKTGRPIQFGQLRYKDLDLEIEGGITDLSLRNAEKLIEEYGTPYEVKLKGEGDTSEHYVIASWETPWGDVSHEFSGFGWGYGGTGAHGLFSFLQLCNIYFTFYSITQLDPSIKSFTVK